MRVAAVCAAAVIAMLTFTTTAASGQDQDATIDITIRYPDGSIVDEGICTNFFAHFGNGGFGFFSASNLPVDSVPVQSGGEVAIQVGGSCVGVDGGSIPLTWSNGIPNDFLFPQDLVTEYLLTVEPGANPVDITVGASRISGTITGPFANECGVHAIGESSIATFEGPSVFRTLPDTNGDYELLVPPGEYNVVTSCFLFSAFEVWPNAATFDAATVVGVEHDDVLTEVDFDISDRFDETEGFGVNLGFSQQDRAVPKCLELYDADGTLVERAVSASFIRTADSREFRVRVLDCFGVGFDNQWYPTGATRTSGPTFQSIDGQIGEEFVAAEPLDGNGFADCNGEEITIRGTLGDDLILGTDGRDVISGLGGDDDIRGFGGNDVICGGDGNDRILANSGSDWVNSGQGRDFVDAGRGNDTVIGDRGNDILRGGNGNDRLEGNNGNDSLRGNNGDDTLIGGKGDDVVGGGRGSDILRGNDGDDELVGSAGPDDQISGGDGTDQCTDAQAGTIFDTCEQINP